MKLWPFRGDAEKVSFLRSSQDTIQVLQDVGRASTQKGVESLGRLTNKAVNVAASGVSLIPASSLSSALGKHLGAAVLASMAFERDARGFGALVLPKESATRLVDLLLAKPMGTTKTLGDLEESAVAETANIALNAMVTATASAARASLKTGVPETTTKVKDRFTALFKPPAGEDHAVILETDFSERNSGVNGTMLLVFFAKVEPAEVGAAPAPRPAAKASAAGRPVK